MTDTDTQALEEALDWLESSAYGDPLMKRTKQCVSARQRIRDLFKQQQELLTEYGRHSEGCNYPHGKEYGCKCGFLNVLKEHGYEVSDD